ncbi:hypothetical protein [Streptomyces griseoaurantiacus]|uniref:hypothetical protein n=1 Tax=Streptomyces griseoaurantiacus TaxID=68213 RepID=UPI002E28EA22|nr:hypothetical protein [Streptomyces jietaisiensis]
MAANDENLDLEAERVYRLWKKGVHRRGISRRVGLTPDQVDRRLARARKNLGGDGLDDLRTDRESSLMDMITEAHKNLAKAETVAERNACIRTVADLQMKLAKLLGLEMPSKVTLEMEDALKLLHTQPDPVWGD